MENIDVDNLIDDNSTFEELSIDDYYSDYYYDKVLQGLNVISSNQNDIIIKQGETNLCIRDLSRFISVVAFLVGLVLVYLFIRDILRL